MKAVTLLMLYMLAIGRLNAQCTSGNCTAGTGTYNYGWCIYTGEFKNSKPEGKGSMKYDDYTYAGHFANGLEDGEGVITHTDGSRETVTYLAGKKVTSVLSKVLEKDYKPIIVQDVHCLSGDCVTGYGTYQFPSGNKYTGMFNNRKREGKGIFNFVDGDKFEGGFHNNEKQSGTYSFSTGAKYTGDYDSNGLEYNGTITSVTGMAIPYVKGRAIIPPAPKMPVGNYDLRGDTRTASGPAQRIKMPCSVCFGTGKTSRTEDRSNYGGAQGGSREYTSMARVYSSCYKCHGSGVE
ncbi:MAG: hypothetical protein ABIN91_10470 [Mucilaginibacter sp.]|uniref:hypothetical protein n=1 Tax=Mucilaginibacter sp. TaxID=1882438 RepID=UPI003265A63A